MCAKKLTAIKALAGVALCAAWTLAYAGPGVGTVSNLSGPLMVKRADGSVKVLAQRSVVEQGDTLVAEKNTYVQIKFIDHAEMILQPDTTVTIDAYAYDEGRKEGDEAKFTLVRGGVRWSTGLLGKRSREKFALVTPSGTMGVLGTVVNATYVAPTGGPSRPGASNPGALPPGLHLFVLDGLIQLSNAGGTQNFSSGQFGFVRTNMTPPILLPNNPGLKFTPPPAFGINSNVLNNNQSKPETVDCEVR